MRYADEWVALVEIDWVNENDLDFRSARVAGHGKTRKEPLDQARPLRARYDEIGYFLTSRSEHHLVDSESTFMSMNRA